MAKKYINEKGQEVARPLSIVIGEYLVTPPTDAQLVQLGWTITEVEETQPTQEAYTPTYEERVSARIRERYSQDAVEALFANYLLDADKYAQEWEDFQAYRAEVKQVEKGGEV